jgi:hypothetical protein
MKQKWIVHVSTHNFEKEKNMIVIAYSEKDAIRKALKGVSDKFGVDYAETVEVWRENNNERK